MDLGDHMSLMLHRKWDPRRAAVQARALGVQLQLEGTAAADHQLDKEAAGQDEEADSVPNQETGGDNSEEIEKVEAVKAFLKAVESRKAGVEVNSDAKKHSIPPEREKWSLQEKIVRSYAVREALDVHSGCVNAIAFSPDAQYLATGSDDTYVGLFHTSDWSKKAKIDTSHVANIFGCTFAPVGHYAPSKLYTCALDGRVCEIDLATARNDCIVNASVPSSMGRRFISRIVFDANIGTNRAFLASDSRQLISLDFRQSASVASGGGQRRRLDPSDSDDESSFTQLSGWTSHAAFRKMSSVSAIAVTSHHPNLLAIGGDTSQVLFYDLRMMQRGLGAFPLPKTKESNDDDPQNLLLRMLMGHGDDTGAVCDLKFSPEGTHLLVNRKDSPPVEFDWTSLGQTLAYRSYYLRDKEAKKLSEPVDLDNYDALFHQPLADIHMRRQHDPELQEEESNLLGTKAIPSDLPLPAGAGTRLESCFRSYSGRVNSKTMFKEVAYLGNDFIVSGGDCGNLFFWSRHSETLVHKAKGDADIINGVLTNPKLPGTIVSCGIDSTTKIWSWQEKYWELNGGEAQSDPQFFLQSRFPGGGLDDELDDDDDGGENSDDEWDTDEGEEDGEESSEEDDGAFLNAMQSCIDKLSILTHLLNTDHFPIDDFWCRVPEAVLDELASFASNPVLDTPESDAPEERDVAKVMAAAMLAWKEETQEKAEGEDSPTIRTTSIEQFLQGLRGLQSFRDMKLKHEAERKAREEELLGNSNSSDNTGGIDGSWGDEEEGDEDNEELSSSCEAQEEAEEREEEEEEEGAATDTPSASPDVNLTPEPTTTGRMPLFGQSKAKIDEFLSDEVSAQQPLLHIVTLLGQPTEFWESVLPLLDGMKDQLLTMISEEDITSTPSSLPWNGEFMLATPCLFNKSYSSSLATTTTSTDGPEGQKTESKAPPCPSRLAVFRYLTSIFCSTVKVLGDFAILGVAPMTPIQKAQLVELFMIFPLHNLCSALALGDALASISQDSNVYEFLDVATGQISRLANNGGVPKAKIAQLKLLAARTVLSRYYGWELIVKKSSQEGTDLGLLRSTAERNALKRATSPTEMETRELVRQTREKINNGSLDIGDCLEVVVELEKTEALLRKIDSGN